MLKVGDMVKASYAFPHEHDPKVYQAGRSNWHTGVVVEVKEVSDLFSEKYAIMETNTYVRVLVEGEVMTFDLEEDTVEVIDESG